jgi:hypothetical protein
MTSSILSAIEDFHIPVVKVHGRFDSAEKLLEFTRPLLGVEGFVVSWPNGHKVKVKAEQYLRIHRIKDVIRTDRHIAAIIINQELDDVLPILDEADMKRVKEYEAAFDRAVHSTVGRIEGLVDIAKVLHGSNKKDIALNFVPNLLYKEDAKFLFSAIDGKGSVYDNVVQKIKGAVGNTTKYEELCKWMNL